jgi:hypothetical protein
MTRSTVSKLVAGGLIALIVGLISVGLVAMLVSLNGRAGMPAEGLAEPAEPGRAA